MHSHREHCCHIIACVGIPEAYLINHRILAHHWSICHLSPVPPHFLNLHCQPSVMHAQRNYMGAPGWVVGIASYAHYMYYLGTGLFQWRLIGGDRRHSSSTHFIQLLNSFCNDSLNYIKKYPTTVSLITSIITFFFSITLPSCWNTP